MTNKERLVEFMRTQEIRRSQTQIMRNLAEIDKMINKTFPKVKK